MVKNLSLPEERATELGRQEHDGLFEVLSSSRRRNALRHLHRVDDPVSFQELAAELSFCERQVDGPTIDREKWDDVAVALRHVHLPVMVDEDVVVYDEVQEIVEPGPRITDAWTLLDALDDVEGDAVEAVVADGSEDDAENE